MPGGRPPEPPERRVWPQGHRRRRGQPVAPGAAQRPETAPSAPGSSGLALGQTAHGAGAGNAVTVPACAVTGFFAVFCGSPALCTGRRRRRQQISPCAPVFQVTPLRSRNAYPTLSITYSALCTPPSFCKTAPTSLDICHCWYWCNQQPEKRRKLPICECQQFLSVAVTLLSPAVTEPEFAGTIRLARGYMAADKSYKSAIRVISLTLNSRCYISKR